MQYLYGLAIQGIQSYIFETSKLKEIVGASELVSGLPLKIVEDLSNEKLVEDNILINAAGNFKYLFVNEESCKKVFTNVPKEFAKRAGNITISQAVVQIDSGSITKEHIQTLEDRLKANRNKAAVKTGMGLVAGKRVARTGQLEVPSSDPDAPLDRNQKLKRKIVKAGNSQLLKILVDKPDEFNFTNNIEEITNDDYQNWIAVIHADGNGLGQKIIRMSNQLKDVKAGFKTLSKILDEATKKAVKTAFEQTVPTNGTVIPIRPIIVGGDDVTVITRGDLAIDYLTAFLAAFEVETKAGFKNFDADFGLENIFANGLTACAGVAFIKSHYPFHYGVGLAEDLCQEAKKVSKKMDGIPSSLMFHKVHSSFTNKWKTIVKKELTSGKTSFVNGPYFLKEQQGYDSIAKLQKWSRTMQSSIAPKTNIREWLAMLSEENKRADDLMKRTQQTLKVQHIWDDLEMEHSLQSEGLERTHLYDVLTIADIQTLKS